MPYPIFCVLGKKITKPITLKKYRNPGINRPEGCRGQQKRKCTLSAQTKMFLSLRFEKKEGEKIGCGLPQDHVRLPAYIIAS